MRGQQRWLGIAFEDSSLGRRDAAAPMSYILCPTTTFLLILIYAYLPHLFTSLIR